MTKTLDTPIEASAELPETPYVGLVPFSELDAPFFFGRERERRLIANNLIASRLTLLYGTSGVGKSSVLRAGVAHDIRRIAKRELAQGRVPELILVVFASWRDPPLPLLAAAIEEAVAETLGDFAPQPPAAERLDDLLSEWVSLIDAVPGDGEVERRTRLLIVLDQFEEYFLYQWQDEDTGRLGDELARAVNREDLRANFAISIREDAYSQLDRFKGRIPNLFESYLRIRHLDPDAAARAIRLPVLETWNGLLQPGATPYAIEDELVAEVLEQVRTGGFFLGQTGGGSVQESNEQRVEAPYLQLVMRRLWLETVRAGEHRLTLARLRELGGAEAIVRAHLEDAMQRLEPRQRDLAAEIFYQLVTSEGTKIAHTVGALSKYADAEPDELAPTLQALSESRILRPVDPPAGQSTPRYEIYHDVLAAPILAWRGRHAHAQEEQRLASELARQEAEAAHQRSAARRFRAVAAIAAVLALLAIAVSVVAIQRQHAATRARNAAKLAQAGTSLAKTRAEASAKVARARALLVTDPAKALELGTAAVNLDRNNRQAINVLRQAALSSRLEVVLHPQAPVIAAAFAGRSSRVVTVRESGAIDIWDGRTWKRLRTLPNPGRSRIQAVFSRDGGRLVVVRLSDRSRYSAEAATVWDTVSGRRLASLRLHTGVVALSPDGRLLALAFRPPSNTFGAARARVPHTVKLWKITRTGARPLPPLRWKDYTPEALGFSPDGTSLTSASLASRGETWAVRTARSVDLPVFRSVPFAFAFAVDVAYSHDGALVATLTGDGTVRVFAARTGKFVAQRRGVGVSSVSAAPDGRFWLGLARGTILIWSPRTHREIQLSGHTDAVNSVAFNSDGTLAATTSSDRTIRVWDARTGEPRGTLVGDTDRVGSAVFSPDGRLIVATSDDGRARVWRTPVNRPQAGLPRLGGANTVSFNDDGTFMLVGNGRRIFVASTSSSRASPRLAIPPQKVAPEAAAFAPDGRLLIGGANGVTVWNLRTGAHATVLPHVAVDAVLAGIGRGRRWAAATARRAHRLIVFDPRTGGESRVLPGRGASDLVSVKSSADGRIVATLGGTTDGWPRIDVWDVAAGKHLLTWREPSDADTFATGIALAPTGGYLAAGTDEGAVLLWRLPARTPTPFRVIQTHVRIDALAFSPKQGALATGGQGIFTDLWSIPAGRKLRSLVGHTGSINSVAFSSDGRAIVTASNDGSVRVWDAISGDPWATFVQGRRHRPLDAEFGPRKWRIAVASSDGTSAIYDCPVCGNARAVLRFASTRQVMSP